uniref:Uncharacterized protein n=1 Tax=Globodera rostochiensis TaxID=31243 RepID=A0A914ICJ3_GLORO
MIAEAIERRRGQIGAAINKQKPFFLSFSSSNVVSVQMAEEEATATTDVVQHQQQQCNKPFCAVYAVENGHQQNKFATRRRGGGGGRSDNIHFQYDQNSYLSVSRTRHIFGSAGGDERSAHDGVGAEEEQQDNEMEAATASWHQTNHGDEQQRRLESLSPFFVRTGLTHCQHTDWDLLREVRVRELTEVRQRVTLMENTMRWWLSAAEQWREKWLKVKNERSRLREENLRLRKALSNAKVELHGLKSSDRSIVAQSPKGICCAETRCRPSPPATTTKTVVVVPPMCEKIVDKENNDCTSSSSNSSKRRRRRINSNFSLFVEWMYCLPSMGFLVPRQQPLKGLRHAQNHIFNALNFLIFFLYSISRDVSDVLWPLNG